MTGSYLNPPGIGTESPLVVGVAYLPHCWYIAYGKEEYPWPPIHPNSFWRGIAVLPPIVDKAAKAIVLFRHI